MADTDPDYDDDGSPKFATETERRRAWMILNHARDPYEHCRCEFGWQIECPLHGLPEYRTTEKEK